MSLANQLVIFADLAPEYALVDTAKISRFLEYAGEDVNSTVFGTKTDRATALLAAHKLTMSLRNSAAVGPVIVDRVGGVLTHYAQLRYNNKQRDWELELTNYGIEFLLMRDTKVPRGGFVL